MCRVPSHVGFAMNEQAVQAARSMIANRNIQSVPLPRSDFKCSVKKVGNSSWKHELENAKNNKATEIQLSIAPLVLIK